MRGNHLIHKQMLLSIQRAEFTALVQTGRLGRDRWFDDHLSGSDDSILNVLTFRQQLTLKSYLVPFESWPPVTALTAWGLRSRHRCALEKLSTTPRWDPSQLFLIRMIEGGMLCRRWASTTSDRRRHLEETTALRHFCIPQHDHPTPVDLPHVSCRDNSPQGTVPAVQCANTRIVLVNACPLLSLRAEEVDVESLLFTSCYPQAKRRSSRLIVAHSLDWIMGVAWLFWRCISFSPARVANMTLCKGEDDKNILYLIFS